MKISCCEYLNNKTVDYIITHNLNTDVHDTSELMLLLYLCSFQSVNWILEKCLIVKQLQTCTVPEPSLFVGVHCNHITASALDWWASLLWRKQKSEFGRSCCGFLTPSLLIPRSRSSSTSLWTTDSFADFQMELCFMHWCITCQESIEL